MRKIDLHAYPGTQQWIDCQGPYADALAAYWKREWKPREEAEVMAVGHGKRLADGKLVPVDVKVGDRILFGKYSSSDIKVDGEEYLIMREDEILGVMEQKPKVANQAG